MYKSVCMSLGAGLLGVKVGKMGLEAYFKVRMMEMEEDAVV